MADQWRAADRQWHAWWSADWQSTPRWLPALGADREAQSLDWPTAAQQSIASRRLDCAHEFRSSASGHSQARPECLHTDPQLGSRRLYSVIMDHLSRRRIRSKRLRTPDPRLTLTLGPLSHSSTANADLSGTPTLLCSSRFPGPPGLSSPPSPDMQLVSRVPFDVVSLPQKPCRCARVHARTLNASQPTGPQVQDSSTAQAGTPNAPPLSPVPKNRIAAPRMREH